MNVLDNPELKKLQMVELNILKDFVRVCDSNNLKYYILAGTLLGAVRHKGFIPWDDDIDVGMPRADFEKFINIYYQELSEQFSLKTYKLDKNYRSYVPKIVNPDIIVQDSSAIVEQLQSAWIDLFPLDGMPNNFFIRKIHSFRLLAARARLNYSRFSTNVNINKQNRPFYERFLIWMGKLLPVEKIFKIDKEIDRMDKLLRKYPYENSDYAINFMGAYRFNDMFLKKYYGDGRLYSFEDSNVIGPCDFEFVLSQIYGDYRKLPAENCRNVHNIKIVNIKS